MKLRTLVVFFVIAILLIGAFTKPDLEKFKEFYSKQHGLNTPPVIEYTNGISYSMFSVTSFGITKNSEGAIAVPAAKAKYLGLFGRFWKID